MVFHFDVSGLMRDYTVVNTEGEPLYSEYNDAARSRVAAIKKMKDCLQAAGSSRVCIAIDWFSVLFMDEVKQIPEPDAADTEQTWLSNGGITLHYQGRGNEHFKYMYDVMFGGENVATLLAFGRNAKFVKEGTVKIDFKNDLLYSSDLWSVYDAIVNAYGLRYRNISRLDIAMDGLNYILDFLNLYQKQDGKNKIIDLKGSARFNAKVLDKHTMKSQNFFIGGSKGRKTATVYNKTLDIVKTGKDYIQKYWKLNGMMNELLPLELELKKLDKEKLYVPGYENVFRFEIRLRGERIAEMENFSIDLLKTTDGLVSILKFMCKRFFEFYWNDNNQVFRCKEIDIIPFDRFNIIPIEKTAKKERTDLYKTKLSINLMVKNLFTGENAIDDFGIWQQIEQYVKKFELQSWMEKRYTKEWKQQYSKLNKDVDHVAQVCEALEDIFNGYNAEHDRQEKLQFL